MNKITVTLKQHTPLLHFQPMQEGATLRASEVKPKLDKFLLARLGGYNYDKGVEIAKEKGWLIGDGANECKALNYKMRIVAREPVDYAIPIKEHKKKGSIQRDDITGEVLYKTLNYPKKMGTLVVGNIEGRLESELLNLVFFESVDIIYLVNNVELATELRMIQSRFFNTFNFGNRKSKGFGSFEAVKINGKKVNVEENEHIYKIYFEMFSKGADLDHYSIAKDVFKVVSDLWDKARYGIKLNKPLLGFSITSDADRTPSIIYFKPYLFYCSEDDLYEIYIYVYSDNEVLRDTGISKDSLSKVIKKRLDVESIENCLKRVRDLNGRIDWKSIEVD